MAIQRGDEGVSGEVDALGGDGIGADGDSDESRQGPWRNSDAFVLQAEGETSIEGILNHEIHGTHERTGTEAASQIF